MAQNKALEFWNGLPMWAKGVIAVGGVAIVYFTGKTIINKLNQKKDLNQQRNTLKDDKKELTNLLNTGVKPTFSDAQYKRWADAIQAQFDGIDWKQNVIDKDVPLIGYWSGSGKMLKDIISQFKNDVDMLKLNDAWGIRTYDQAGILTGDVTGNLQKCVLDELDRGERLGLNNILAKKKISYRFG